MEPYLLFKDKLNMEKSMTLSEYITKVTDAFSDKRVIKKAQNLLKKIVEHKTIKLYTTSKDKQEFDRSKNLINSRLNTVLDDKKISNALIKNS